VVEAAGAAATAVVEAADVEATAVVGVDAAGVVAGAVAIGAGTAGTAGTAGKKACRNKLAAFQPFGAPHYSFRELLQSRFAPGCCYHI